MEPHFEFFDHTADMGVRVRAETLPALFQTAAEAFYAAIGELAVQPDSTPITIVLSANDAADLLQDFLSSLLVTFESNHAVIRDVDFETLTQHQLIAHARAHPLDEPRCVFHREVKAITYHQLSVTKTSDGYEAAFILDI